MQHMYCVEPVDRSLQDICGNQKPFKGITVVLGGYSRQIFLVLPKRVREQIISISLRRSRLWQKLYDLSLSENMCLDATENGQTDWAKYLMELHPLASLFLSKTYIYFNIKFVL